MMFFISKFILINWSEQVSCEIPSRVQYFFFYIFMKIRRLLETLDHLGIDHTI